MTRDALGPEGEMATLPVGFLMMILVIFLSVERGSWGLFLNEHAVIIVCGGTLALLAFTTPLKGLRSLGSALADLFRKEHSLSEYREDFRSLTQSKSLSQPSSNPLINLAAELWGQGVSHELFIVLISQKRAELEDQHLDAITALRSLAKYPPALGMTGTVIGMVALFAKLGNDDASSLGAALALAMTATFFGLIVANGIVQPLADRLFIRHVQTKRLYKNVYQLLLLINNGEAHAIVDDEVSFRAAA
jgi:chemotaxis protein MotA